MSILSTTAESPRFAAPTLEQLQRDDPIYELFKTAQRVLDRTAIPQEYGMSKISRSVSIRPGVYMRLNDFPVLDVTTGAGNNQGKVVYGREKLEAYTPIFRSGMVACELDGHPFSPPVKNNREKNKTFFMIAAPSYYEDETHGLFYEKGRFVMPGGAEGLDESSPVEVIGSLDDMTHMRRERPEGATDLFRARWLEYPHNIRFLVGYPVVDPALYNECLEMSQALCTALNNNSQHITAL